MKYVKNCEDCGHQVTAYTHKLNTQLVIGLGRLIDRYLITKKPVNLQKELVLTKNQYNNFQKLQYFGLIIHSENGWVPTLKGEMFIKGEISIKDTVATFGKLILDDRHEAWTTHTGKIRLVHISQLDQHWKKKEDYKEEKRNTLF